MALVTLEEAKSSLKVETADEDAMIGVLLATAEIISSDVARLTDEEWEIVNSDVEETDTYTAEELTHIRSLMKVAILYAVGHMFEFRDEADYHGMTLTLRSILFSIREGKV